MLRFVTTAATLALIAIAAPADAKPIESTVMSDTGSAIKYSAHLAAHDMIVITGTELATASPIDLIVDANGRVDGRIGMDHVSFAIPQAKRDRVVAELRDDVTETAPTVFVASK